VLTSALAKLPLRDRLVMMSRRKIKRSIDFATMSDYMKKHHPDVKVVELYDPMESPAKYLLPLVRQFFYLTTSRWVITDGYSISISTFPPRKGVTIAQVWHALGTIKQFGRLTVGTSAGVKEEIAEKMRMHRNYSFVAAPSRSMVDKLAAAFGVNAADVQVIGSPRIDYLLTANRANTRKYLAEKYNLDPSRPIYMYVPTYRDGRAVPLKKLAKVIKNADEQFLVHLHTRDKRTARDFEGLTICDEDEAVIGLPGVDGVLTDYSGVMLEAGIIGLPIALWTYDLDEYKQSPGFVISFEEILGDIMSKDPKTALDILRKKVSTTSTKTRDFLASSVETADTHNCERLADALGITKQTGR